MNIFSTSFFELYWTLIRFSDHMTPRYIFNINFTITIKNNKEWDNSSRELFWISLCYILIIEVRMAQFRLENSLSYKGSNKPEISEDTFNINFRVKIINCEEWKLIPSGIRLPSGNVGNLAMCNLRPQRNERISILTK